MKNELLIREILNEKWIEPSYINDLGTMIWHNEYGELHSNKDKPAIIFLNGNKLWYKNGKRHRDEDKPAVIFSDGRKRWYKNGEFIK